MATQLTDALRKQLLELDLDPSNFAAEFDHWKSIGDEYSSYLFGKDGAYSRPLVNGQPNTLRHIHLVPLADPVALQRWDKAFQRGARKTSDRALVYVSDSYYGNLLLFILDEPTAHEVSLMKTPLHRKLMHQFAAVADKFIHTGEILA